MLAYTELERMAQNGLTEPPALTSVFFVFVYSATQVYASNPYVLLSFHTRRGA